MSMVSKYVKDLKTEFKGYNAQKLGKDLTAGLTVCAVPLHVYWQQPLPHLPKHPPGRL